MELVPQENTIRFSMGFFALYPALTFVADNCLFQEISTQVSAGLAPEVSEQPA
ncbi:MAG: hypothetical protein ACLFT1_06635 [Desulfonatronovibrio sp.]